jgi:hypothetical protein
LAEAGMKFWRKINSDYVTDDSGTLDALLLACEALDRAQAGAETIARGGEKLLNK